jgi:hypothetical protein
MQSTIKGVILSETKNLLLFQRQRKADLSLLHPSNGKGGRCRGPWSAQDDTYEVCFVI